jgi:hypothetical protein
MHSVWFSLQVLMFEFIISILIHIFQTLYFHHLIIYSLFSALYSRFCRSITCFLVLDSLVRLVEMARRHVIFKPKHLTFYRLDVYPVRFNVLNVIVIVDKSIRSYSSCIIGTRKRYLERICFIVHFLSTVKIRGRELIFLDLLQSISSLKLLS